MNCSLAEIIVVARNGDRNWMNILFIVVIAIFYAIGSIVKARANKLEEQKQRGGKPGFKPPRGTRQEPTAFKKTAYEQAQKPAGRPIQRPRRPQIWHPRAKPAPAQPVAQKLPGEKRQAVQLPTFEPLEGLKLPPVIPSLQTGIKEVQQSVSKPLKPLEDKHLAVSAETLQPETVPRLLPDIDELDKLKRAILHYEILGRPLSLRGPSEQIIGL